MERNDAKVQLVNAIVLLQMSIINDEQVDTRALYFLLSFSKAYTGADIAIEVLSGWESLLRIIFKEHVQTETQLVESLKDEIKKKDEKIKKLMDWNKTKTKIVNKTKNNRKKLTISRNTSRLFIFMVNANINTDIENLAMILIGIDIIHTLSILMLYYCCDMPYEKPGILLV